MAWHLVWWFRDTCLYRLIQRVVCALYGQTRLAFVFLLRVFFTFVLIEKLKLFFYQFSSLHKSYCRVCKFDREDNVLRRLRHQQTSELLHLLTVALYDLSRFMTSDYHFGVLNLFLCECAIDSDYIECCREIQTILCPSGSIFETFWILSYLLYNINRKVYITMDYVSLFCTVTKVKKKQYHTLRTVVCQINGFYLLNVSSNQIFIIVSRYYHTSVF
jgi:hypothetical protein